MEQAIEQFINLYGTQIYLSVYIFMVVTGSIISGYKQNEPYSDGYMYAPLVLGIIWPFFLVLACVAVPLSLLIIGLTKIGKGIKWIEIKIKENSNANKTNN